MVSSEEDFELLCVLDLKLMTIFKCVSDVRMLRSEGDDASWGILMEKFPLGVRTCMVERTEIMESRTN